MACGSGAPLPRATGSGVLAPSTLGVEGAGSNPGRDCENATAGGCEEDLSVSVGGCDPFDPFAPGRRYRVKVPTVIGVPNGTSATRRWSKVPPATVPLLEVSSMRRPAR